MQIMEELEFCLNNDGQYFWKISVIWSENRIDREAAGTKRGAFL